MKSKKFVFKEPVNAAALSLAADKIRRDAQGGYGSIRLDFTDVSRIAAAELVTLFHLRDEAASRFHSKLDFIFKKGSDCENDYRELADSTRAASDILPDDFEIHLAENGVSEVDVGNCELLVQWAEEALAQKAQKISFNFAGVHFINAAGIMTLVMIQKKIQAAGAELFLLLPDQSIIYDLIRKNSLMEEFHIKFISET
ncbi:MAG: STAS domain-containing protein [Spirochaetia bacterium]|nr:STAS domain-containing protein [Spirochaetia bacterium]